MVIAAARSATTWCANWLTTDTTLCLHDPLWKTHYSEWDAIQSTHTLGISCTGIALFPEWVNQHPARKVVLHRDAGEINASLEKIGLPPLAQIWCERLESIQGMHCHWEDVFERPQRIYEHLLQRPMDWERHALLKEIRMQPLFERLQPQKEVGERLIAELSV